MRWRIYRAGHEPDGRGWCYTSEEDARHFYRTHGDRPCELWAELVGNSSTRPRRLPHAHVLVISEGDPP